MSGTASAATGPRRTALYETHVALGATLTDFAGWSMPLRYSGDLAEHHAVREQGGLFDLSHMGEIELDGPAAAAALNYALVGKYDAMPVGKAKYTMICQEDGGVVDDLIVYRTGDLTFLVVANASNADTVARLLRERADGFDTTVTDRSAETSLLALQGPVAVSVLQPLTDTDLSTVKYYAGYRAVVGGIPVLLARTGYTGEDGFELFCANTDAPALWATLLGAGAAAGVQPCGLACRDSLRLEAGMPLYGNELDTSASPFEAGLGKVVALDKDDFVGKSALTERSAQPPQRRLIGLIAAGRRAPRHGYPVIDPQTGQAVGTVTSGVPSPTLAKSIAMAYIDNDLAVPDTRLAVDVRGKQEAVDVVALPFYRRAK